MPDDTPFRPSQERRDIDDSQAGKDLPIRSVPEQERKGAASDGVVDSAGFAAERAIRTAFLYNLSYAELADLGDVSVDRMRTLVRKGLAAMLSSVPDSGRQTAAPDSRATECGAPQNR